MARSEATILTGKIRNTSLVLAGLLTHIQIRPAVHAGLAGGETTAWLSSAKGGDPMSHGSAGRSVTARAEHYR